MPTNKQMLSITEVLNLPPGDEATPTWINPGFIAFVEKVVSTKAKTSGKPMHICTLVEKEGSNEADISMIIFRPTIPFKEGDTIEVCGKGLRRIEYNGMAQASLSNDTEIHVVRREVKQEEEQRKPAATSPRNDTRGGGENPELEEQPAHDTAHGHRINGQTTGMAMKEALALLTKELTHDAVVERVVTPTFWASVHEVASDIIRVSLLLETGKLAKPVKERGPAEDQQVSF